MTWGVLAAIAFVVVALLVLMLRRRTGPSPDAYPYQQSGPLFSPAERSFFGVLEDACGADFKIFGKVRVADVVAPLGGMDASHRQTAFNKISSKHFDFLLCSVSDLSVSCVIELNDRSHQRTKRQSRDQFLRGVCRAASLPLLEFTAKRNYSTQEVRDSVQVALAKNTAPLASPCPVVRPGNPQPAIARAEPLCPECSTPMVRRKGRRGALAGKEFWGCANYPKCRATVPINA